MVSTDERVEDPGAEAVDTCPRPTDAEAEARADPHADAGGETGADPMVGGGADEAEEAAAPDRRPRTVRRRFLAGAAVLLAVALLAAGAGLLFKARQLRDTPAADNLALTDTAATARVVGDVSNALGTVFSYGPRDTGATKESARRYLGGKALQQYAALFGQVEKQARDQELTLTTRVVKAGVTRLTGTGAHLLVFLDQVHERRGRPATTAAAQLSVTAELRGGHWRIVDIAAR
ncbi:hypothetical protein ACFYYY_14315 [Streptomyces sp. NPDC001834]|uniref:hypothetical protein n=2 Tax=unclassified Streptomyces TaxID=2593676 RepID=UPI0036940C60